MTVVSVDQDPAALSMTLVAAFSAPVEAVWELWSDPRKLERWWGPPSHPATFEAYELSPGGRVAYFMTSPEGERYPGAWRVVSVDPPRSIQFNEGFADANGDLDPEQPITLMTASLSSAGGGTRMELRCQFASPEDMQQILAMGTA